jgi:basic membrane protein A
MRNKKFAFLALLVALPLVVVACGDDEGGGGCDVTIGLVYDLGGRGDQSFNDSAAVGLDRAKQEFDIADECVTELEPSAGGENREELLNLVSDQGADLVLAIGFLFAESVQASAVAHPDTSYGVVDTVVEATNVRGMLFAEHEGSFLVGAAAALKSETGHIGFIGGVEIELIQKFHAGYVAGARAVNPDIVIDIAYISQPPDFSGFNDPAKGQEIATGMFDAGADVVYAAAGGSGGGLFQAATEAGTWAIGVDSDQALTAPEFGPDGSDVILTSMVKRVDSAVYATIKDFVNGEFSSGARQYGLADGGITYATTGGHVDDIKDQLDAFAQQIIDGTIVVPTTP